MEKAVFERTPFDINTAGSESKLVELVMRDIDHLSYTQRQEISKYGCTIQQMDEVVNMRRPSLTPADMVSSIIQSVSRDISESMDDMLIMDVKQALNRANWIITNKINELHM